ncbi:MAG: glycoside hydrolase family 43 protein [Muribaculaceae bacterium]|jgi:Beta-xylosidase|nr:glycoside hydrolase family 43 protein [Muribaculaceae bacterium]
MEFKYVLAGVVAALSVIASGCGGKSVDKYVVSEVANPIPVKFGDPFVLAASDGKYYMYGTSLADGFEAYVSDDMSVWEPLGKVYQGGGESQWNVDCFWAPEVYERDGKYYMFYSSNAKDNPGNDGENFKIGVAVSDSPAGPFSDLYDRPVFNPPYPVIDANVLFEDDGRCYLYFSRCCYEHAVDSEIADKARQEGFCDEVEESWVYGVEMQPDFSGVIGEPQLLLAPPSKLDDIQAEWESRSVANKEVNRRWTEGSYIFKDGDKYYMMYSANHYGGKYYAVGYATSDSPLGPFVKSDVNPVLEENVSQGGIVMGTGHNMVVTMPDSSRYCVYHGRMSSNPDERVVFFDRLEVDSAGVLHVEGPTTTPQKIAVRRI